MTFPSPPYGGYPPPYGSYRQPKPTNGMAVAALVCAFLFAPLGILFGHISLSQIKRSGEEGHGLAVAGLVIGYLMTALGVIIVVSSLVFFVLLARSVNQALDWTPDYPGITAAPTPVNNQLPAFNPPPNLGANCTYPSTAEPAAKPAKPPPSGPVATQPANVAVTMSTNQGNIGLQLDKAKAPCTVNNFTSLAAQGYFDSTACHRLTTSPTLSVLQCGDPTGSGTGVPGYQFANEYPTNQYRLTDPALQQPLVYPRGTLATANAGPGTNGSQFFLIYADSQLPPLYTVFGTIDATGLATLDRIAAGGVERGADDGRPAIATTITSVRPG